jgi:hypothetical protein
LEEDTESYEEARRNYLHTRFPPLISVSDIRPENIPNQLPRNDLFDYYSEDGDRQNQRHSSPFISIFDIRHRDIQNRFPQDDTLEDQLQYFRLQPRNNEGIQEEDFNLQQEDNEEQNNPIEQEQDEVRQEQELNLEEEDNEEQENPVQGEEAEVQQNQRRSTGFGQLFDPTEVLDNQVQPYTYQHNFSTKKWH